MGLSFRAIVVALLLMMLLSIPVGYYSAVTYGEVLESHGLSYEHLDADPTEAEMLRFHPVVLLIYGVRLVVTVSLPAFVAARLSKERRIRNAMAVGGLSIALYFSVGGDYSDIVFSVFVIAATLLSAYLGGLLCALVCGRPKPA